MCGDNERCSALPVAAEETEGNTVMRRLRFAKRRFLYDTELFRERHVVKGVVFV